MNCDPVKCVGGSKFIAKLRNEEKFIAYNNPEGMLVGDEFFKYDPKANVLRWMGLKGKDNERQIVAVTDSLESAIDAF